MAPRRTSTPKHPPNRQLTWARLQRGWSREELVEQIRRSMAAENEQDTGLTVETVRRWETGDRKPELRYKKHLVLVFGKPAGELGLLSAEELALGRSLGSDVALTDSFTSDGFVDLIVGRLVGVLVGGDGEFGRDLFLKSLLGASLAPLASGELTPPVDAEALAGSRRTRLDPRVVDAYSEITAAHRGLYWTSSADDLLPSVIAQVRMGGGLLKSTSTFGGRLQQRLAAAVAESALLASRLSFFDLAMLRPRSHSFDWLIMRWSYREIMPWPRQWRRTVHLFRVSPEWRNQHDGTLRRHVPMRGTPVGRGCGRGLIASMRRSPPVLAIRGRVWPASTRPKTR